MMPLHSFSNTIPIVHLSVSQFCPLCYSSTLPTAIYQCCLFAGFSILPTLRFFSFAHLAIHQCCPLAYLAVPPTWLFLNFAHFPISQFFSLAYLAVLPTWIFINFAHLVVHQFCLLINFTRLPFRDLRNPQNGQHLSLLTAKIDRGKVKIVSIAKKRTQTSSG